MPDSNDLKKIFPNFSNELVEEIESNSIFQSFKAGDVIMRTGQYINNTVLILKGQIKIYREGENGGEFLMYYLHPGQACAISMICSTKSQTSQITAKAVEDGELLMIPVSLMEKWMMNHRSWYEFVIYTYRTRFEEVLEVIDNVAFRAMDERLEFYLKRHSAACGCKEINLSHQEIATELNTSREVISRLLKKMEQRGLVNLHRNQIELLM
jgi:CRP/FNR family transcriptional regulator